MEKNWDITFACVLNETDDSKTLNVKGRDESEALMNVEKLPNRMTHCAHGPLKVIEISQNSLNSNS